MWAKHREYGTPPAINLGPMYYEYSTLFQVYTFFWWRLYVINIHELFRNIPTQIEIRLDYTKDVGQVL